MNIFVCVDDDMGMLFNNRRQSKDSKVIEKILEIVGESGFYVNEFSKSLFPDNAVVSEDFLDTAEQGDYCFVENVDVAEYLFKIEKVYLFRWNRRYPGDFGLTIDLANGYSLKHSEEFVGSSHDKITMEVWEK